ncbi:TusE/DsrC/DsvC family sulfur relay protein [Sinisalibacter aestuarii]|uniref:Sulfurtransferase TusE n=1 Tax=Sinisalibacter aestuarii TaxID=2949426 RepID=A0ABQ5LVV5_9RHOB|nr:TusE/DsrC/DsvC family sulfur relay protein [Sinisalibacter aestuarii]GKY89117.1 sulfurtransferase TusE [Sinisalibacter aestuarii]
MRTRPDKLTTQVIAGHSILRDEAGYLVDPEMWTEDIARQFADEEGVALNDEHWAVIRFMRDYLDEHGIAADARFAFRFLASRHKTDVSGGRARFFALFPYGYVKQACKIAGMRQPRAWSTG